MTIKEPDLRNPAWDLAAFALGLGLAWLLDWQTRDLVWGLWLSSFVLGYASIVVGILGGVSRAAGPGNPVGWLPGLFGGLFLLAFFTVHFGGFHFVHSIFLNQFFPIAPATGSSFGPGFHGYMLVLRDYWPWLIAASIAERGMLVKAWGGSMRNEPGRDRPNGRARPEFNPMLAYVNVVRMHLLIFFFAGTAAAGIDNVATYAVVYAVYFFPWSFAKNRAAARKAATG